MAVTAPSVRMVDAFRATRLLAGETRLLAEPHLASYECRALTDPAEVAAAKELQGRSYVHQRHVPADRLTAEGWVPWHDCPPGDRVRWFGVSGADGGLVAVGRKIFGGPPDTLPAFRFVGPDLPAALNRCPPGGAVEPSGVAKLRHAPLLATLLIYRALYQDSVRRGERLWLMTLMPALRTTLSLVTPGAITIGPRPVPVREDYPGVRSGVLAYPAWGEVATFTTRIRAVGDAAHDSDYRRFLHLVATFLDDELEPLGDGSGR